MERLLRVEDIMTRYGCCRQTACKRMREMQHMSNPLLVTEWAVMDWERHQMEENAKPKAQRGKTKRREYVTPEGPFIIPRRRA